jgi:penicillin-binding protein 1A
MKIAKTGVHTVGDVISLIFKIIGTILLIVVTTGLIFSCIFVIYMKTNLTTGLDIDPESFTLSLSSKLYYTDPDTGLDEELVTLQSDEFRVWTDYEEIPLDMVHALVAIEDHRFYQHQGVDWYRTAGAFVNMFLSMKDTFGGSTVTQQLIKNLTKEDEVTVQRKLLEIFRALEFEKEYDKVQILEWYMNVVYFGYKRYGVGAAADFYFGKTVSELSLAECASIIGITNNPSRFNPYLNSEQNKKRQEEVLSAMYRYGYISEAQLRAAKAEKLVFKRGENSTVDTVVYTWFEEAVINDVIADLMDLRGISEYAAKILLYHGGYRIYTTQNPRIQEKVNSVYLDLENLPKVTGSEQQLQSAIVIVDPYTGDVVALCGGVGEKPPSNLLFNRATMARRPPGSSIKPLSVYSLAMDRGLISPETRIDDGEDVTLSGTDWMPKNDDWSYLGVINIRTAIVRSRNTVAAQVLDMLTPAVSYRFMRETLGFKLDVFDENYAPLSLGQLTHGATVREMATAYTMFDNAGRRMDSRTYTKILDDDFNLVYENKPTGTPAISAKTAYWMTSILNDAATFGTGSEANLGSMPTAGKTGTTSDKKDRWFVGYTPYYVAAVWTGYDTPAVMTVRGNPASQLWKRVMTLVHEDLETKSFPAPEDTYLPPVTGIREVEYTVQYAVASGVVFYTQTKTGSVGRTITESAPLYENFIIVGDESQTMTLDENPTKNVMEFFYKYVPAETSPEPEPSAEPEPPPEEPSPPAESPYEPPETAEPPPSAEPETPPPEEPPGWLVY